MHTESGPRPADLAPTLHAGLDDAVRRVPDRVVRFHSDGEQLTYAELAAASRRSAARLAADGVGPGGVVALLAGNSAEFLVTVFAASRLGAAVAPLPLPMGLRDLAGYAERAARILVASDATHLVLADRLQRLLGSRLELPCGVRLVGSGALTAPGQERPDRPVDPASPAVLQFTSGSTSAPKGVVLTHDNVTACAASIMEAIALGPADAHASWLPLFHDMGLFGTLTGIFTGIPVNLWAPAAFVKDPARWLGEFAATRSTISTMPNFAFDALVDAVPDPTGLDLSAWRVAFNGAELIRASSVRTFAAHFAGAGFRPQVMTPGYGMAEATLVATLPPLGRGPVVEHVDRDVLAATGVAHPREPDGPGVRTIVGLGHAVPTMAVRIAGEADAPLPDGRVGEIQLRGPAVTGGYLAPAAQPFTEDGWLATGDLGYLRAGELFFTGRVKEMITVRGTNCYPTDVEAEAAHVPGVRKGRCVAYADLDAPGGERIAVVAETALTDVSRRAALTSAIARHVSRSLGITALAVHLVEPGAIPRTTSGKLRRLHAAAVVAGSPSDTTAQPVPREEVSTP
ncbi:MAG: hypothetical protein ABS81_00125 [Pseudonocardia sp. SCN 72-86]|nr:MAG: hypothetical protein ABS81_00125 [Pseudonocardia sp. SCN 72-86]